MSDITSLFKATVKTVKSRNKALGTVDKDKSSILPHARQKGDFEAKAKDLVKIMTKLREYLAQHRKDYINAGSHLICEKLGMTDSERDQIDNDCQKVIKSCQETVRQFRKEEVTAKVCPQVRDHRDCVLQLIDIYLKCICKLYSEQRAVRVKRVVDRKRISRLEPDRKKPKSDVSDLLEKKDMPGEDGKSVGVKARAPLGSNSIIKSPLTSGGLEEDSGADMGEEEEISSEEAQMFEQENKAVYDELNSMMHEVRQIEGRVVEISRLQEILSEKVLEQEKDVDRIADTVVGTTENIVEGNEQIREALQKNAGFRVWILFFLLVCSLSLLFLDWYNA